MSVKEYAGKTLSNLKYAIVAFVIGLSLYVGVAVVLGIVLGFVFGYTEGVLIGSFVFFVLLMHVIGDYAMTYYNVKRVLNDD